MNAGSFRERARSLERRYHHAARGGAPSTRWTERDGATLLGGQPR